MGGEEIFGCLRATKSDVGQKERGEGGHDVVTNF